MASSKNQKFYVVLTIISKAGLFCLQVRRHMHHITPICDYEKTSMRIGGGGSYSLCTKVSITIFIFWLCISQVEKVLGNCYTLSQGLEHSEVSCYLLLKLLFVVVSHILLTDSTCYWLNCLAIKLNWTQSNNWVWAI